MQRDDFKVRRFPGIESVGLSDAPSRLRVAIVTEEIIGPVRNGGIASTYYHLAKGLAAQGHEVHVLYLKGAVVDDETPEFWAKRYAEFGISLHYLDVPRAQAWAASPNWQLRYAAAYEWLRDQDTFDVVHTSEWRGGLVYALMAKRLGLAFRDTLFLVKASSPHVWNRHYQMLPITDTHLVAAAHAEQMCVELADMVIGGSAHLLSFMERIGYRLPPTNVFVQPNIVDFSNVPVVDRRLGPPRQQGDVVKSRDLVFFGRLEARKGIEMFCGAIDLLHERGEIPDSVTFLGKFGGKLAAQGGMSPEQYIQEKAESWDCPVVTVTDKNQPEALTFLTQRDRIAVMPSLIENSTMAVYETLELCVPFIATAVGGTAELIAEADHPTCLVEPTAQALADRLAAVLRDGQVIAHPRRSNEENLDVWYRFHARLGEMMEQHGRSAAVDRLIEGIDSPGTPVGSISHVALVRRSDSLEELIKSCQAEAPDELLLGYTDVQVRSAIEQVRELLDGACPNVRVVDCMGQTAGTALNSLVASQTSDAMLITDGLSALPQDGFFAAARQALGHRPGCLFTSFFSTTGGAAVGLPLGSDVASHVLTSRAYGPEAFAIRADTFAAIGAFEPYDARRGIVHEYLTRAAESGRELLVLPEQLLAWPRAEDEATEFRNDQHYGYLKAKSLIDAAGLSQRKVLLAALSGAAGRPVGTVDEWLLRSDSVGPDEIQWLIPSSWAPESLRATRERNVFFGLDKVRGELWLFARGPGERRLLVRGEEVPTRVIASRGVPGTVDHVTLALFPVPKSWSPATSYPLLWELFDGEETLRAVFLRVNKVGARTFALSGRTPALPTQMVADLMADLGKGGDPIEWVVDNAPADPQVVVEQSRALLTETRGAAPLSAGSGLRPTTGAGDWREGDWLTGWAWDRDADDRTLHVAVVRDDASLLVVPADVVDRSLEKVPGRGRHAYRIPVLPEFLDGPGVHLEIWEGGLHVPNGALVVAGHGPDRVLRRAPNREDLTPPATSNPEPLPPASRRRIRWPRRTR